jgi:dihydropyrimidinase
VHFDTLVMGARVVTPLSAEPKDLGIVDGRIAAILPPGAQADATTEIDATGMLATPGGIDTHTHVRWPHDGTHTVDDFFTATRAAVLGGTTMIVDFVPPGADGTLLQRCHDRVDEALPDVVVDFALHPILTSASDQVLRTIDRIVRDGFTSFKMYTTYQDRRVDDGAAWQLMGAIAASGGVPGFHAENHELIEDLAARQANAGNVRVRDFPDSRPALAEAETIQMVSLYARRLGVPVYIFHVSGAEPLAAIRDARRAGTSLVAETCTHYLVLDRSVFERPDAWKFVIAPPLRTAADRDALWEAVLDGTICAVGSDHCAYRIDRKTPIVDDHRAVPAGAPGIEARTPLLFDGVQRRGLGPRLFGQITATRAARALGLHPRKGSITVGADADLVLWRPDQPWRADEATTASPHTFALYNGMRTQGTPEHVFVRGTQVVRHREFVGTRGHGKFLARPPAARSHHDEPAQARLPLDGRHAA